MYPEQFTTEKFRESLKARTIWFNNFKVENIRIKAMLADAFHPYQVLLNKEFDSSYEIDSYLFIKDKNAPSISVGNLFGYETKPYIELNLYLMPIDMDDFSASPQLSLFDDEKENFERLIKKFSQEVGMEVEIIYG